MFALLTLEKREKKARVVDNDWKKCSCSKENGEDFDKFDLF